MYCKNPHKYTICIKFEKQFTLLCQCMRILLACEILHKNWHLLAESRVKVRRTYHSV